MPGRIGYACGLAANDEGPGKFLAEPRAFSAAARMRERLRIAFMPAMHGVVQS